MKTLRQGSLPHTMPKETWCFTRYTSTLRSLCWQSFFFLNLIMARCIWCFCPRRKQWEDQKQKLRWTKIWTSSRTCWLRNSKKSQTTGRRCTRSKKEQCSSALCISRGLVSLEALRLSRVAESLQNKELQSHRRLLLRQKRDNIQIIWNGRWSKWRSFSIHSVAPDSRSFWTRHAHKSGYDDPVIPFERNFSAILSQVYCGSENRRKSCCETTGEKSHSWACSLHDFWRNELSTVKHRFWAQQWAWYVRNVCSDKSILHRTMKTEILTCPTSRCSFPRVQMLHLIILHW